MTKEIPAWIKNGMFGKDKSPHGVTYEADTDQHKKHHENKHHCCGFFHLCALALIAGHIYQLRNLSNSLIALDSLGATMKDYKKVVSQTATTAVVADEE